MATNISIENFSLQIQKKILLQDTKLIITEGNKYGIVGKNGIGKSTLLNYINTKQKHIPKNLDIYMVQQELPSDSNLSVFDTVIQANIKRTRLLEQIQELENLDTYSEKLNDLYDELNNMHSEESKVKSILHGLGIEKDQQNKPVSFFSGGWIMRISLARALYMKPSLLLLDEPSNHLDLEALIWLTNYLSKKLKKTTIIIVSHDKNFLNNICNCIIHIESCKLNYYKGNYDDFEIHYKNNLILNEKKWKLFEKNLNSLKNNNKLNKEEKSKKIKQLEELNLMYKPIKLNKIKFSLTDIETKTTNILEMNNVSFGYNDILFSNLNLIINYGDKITIVGKNGSGKSTIFNLILNKLKPINGIINIMPNIRLGYYSQHSHEVLDQNLSPVEYLKNKVVDLDNLHEEDINNKYNKNSRDKHEFLCRKYLGDIGLESSVHNQKIETLSGGQKARVVFASLFVEKPHLILLDEPTNHLDLETIDAMIYGINNFNGAVIIITHNIDLINNTNSIIYELVDKELKITDFESYQEKIIFDDYN